jgi:hypothetical protein
MTKPIESQTTEVLPGGTTISTLHLTKDARRGLSTHGAKIRAGDEPPFTGCDWHSEHSADDRPIGTRCGAPAAYRVLWLDGTYRYSHSCSAHLTLDADVPPHLIETLEVTG